MRQLIQRCAADAGPTNPIRLSRYGKSDSLRASTRVHPELENPMSDLIIVARVEAKPGHAKELVAAQVELVQAARKQPGCLLYDLHEDEDQPGRVLFFERWRDRASWEAHMKGAHITAFRTKAGHLIGTSELLKMRQVA